MIDAMQLGVLEVVKTRLNLTDAVCGVRPGGQGRPAAAYKGGGWYFGVSYAGKTASNPEATYYECTYSVLIAVTYIAAQVPTAKRGDWFMSDGGLLLQADRLFETLLGGDSGITNACNDVLNNRYNTAGSTRTFFEDFNTGSMGADRLESADWVVSNVEKAPTVHVVSFTVSGLKYAHDYGESPL